jgi:hypothetical protein
MDQDIRQVRFLSHIYRNRPTHVDQSISKLEK